MLWTTRGAVLLGAAALVTTLTVIAGDATHGQSRSKISPTIVDRQQSGSAATHSPTESANGTPTATSPQPGAPAIDRSTHYSRTFEAPAVVPSAPGENIARTALAFRGVPYRFGGRSVQSGFDCSGLVQTVCAKWGIYLPRVAGAQFTRGVRVKPADLQPGDLVFFQGTYKRGLSHVGIFIGDDHFVHAAGRGKGVRISSLSDAYYQHHWAGARRLDLTRLPKSGNEPVFTAREITIDMPEEAPVRIARRAPIPESAPRPIKNTKSPRAAGTDSLRPDEHVRAQAILEETTTTGPRDVVPAGH